MHPFEKITSLNNICMKKSNGSPFKTLLCHGKGFFFLSLLKDKAPGGAGFISLQAINSTSDHELSMIM